MNLHTCFLALLILVSGAVRGQSLDVTLADPPSANALRAAAGLSYDDAVSVRGLLAFHRGHSQETFDAFLEARYKGLVALVGAEVMMLYDEFRLKGQALNSDNAAYRADSRQRRASAGEGGGANASVNLLTRQTVDSLLTRNIISEVQARAMLQLLGDYRVQREALYARWDGEKNSLLAADESLDLSDNQRQAVIDADRLAIRAGLLHGRQGEGLKRLRGVELPSSP
ncbi:MAG: hypothetical protein OXQ29_05435 [Rhodospirillaceae bacterium]|nr:hypothetical protein [Rhodospirillaceae bacterium]